MAINDGGPAFPLKRDPELKLLPKPQYVNNDHPGMSLRDYFAAHALTGALANQDLLLGNYILDSLDDWV